MTNERNILYFEFQWDEYYRKAALKQRRGSAAYRITKPQVFNNHLASTASLTRPSSAIKEDSPRTNQVSPLRPHTNGVSTQNNQKNIQDTSVKDYKNGTLDNIGQNRSKSPIHASKKSLLSNEKSSTACTIQ